MNNNGMNFENLWNNINSNLKYVFIVNKRSFMY